MASGWQNINGFWLAPWAKPADIDYAKRHSIDPNKTAEEQNWGADNPAPVAPAAAPAEIPSPFNRVETPYDYMRGRGTNRAANVSRLTATYGNSLLNAPVMPTMTPEERRLLAHYGGDPEIPEPQPGRGLAVSASPTLGVAGAANARLGTTTAGPGYTRALPQNQADAFVAGPRGYGLSNAAIAQEVFDSTIGAAWRAVSGSWTDLTSVITETNKPLDERQESIQANRAAQSANAGPDWVPFMESLGIDMSGTYVGGGNLGLNQRGDRQWIGPGLSIGAPAAAAAAPTKPQAAAAETYLTAGAYGVGKAAPIHMGYATQEMSQALRDYEKTGDRAALPMKFHDSALESLNRWLAIRGEGVTMQELGYEKGPDGFWFKVPVLPPVGGSTYASKKTKYYGGGYGGYGGGGYSQAQREYGVTWRIGIT